MIVDEVTGKPFTPGKGRIVLAVVSHAACWSVLIFAMVGIFPRQIRVMQDYGLPLSRTMLVVNELSDLVSRNLFFTPLALVAMLALDAAVLSLLRGRGGGRSAFAAWILLVGVVPLAAVLISSLTVMQTLGDLGAQLQR